MAKEDIRNLDRKEGQKEKAFAARGPRNQSIDETSVRLSTGLLLFTL